MNHYKVVVSKSAAKEFSKLSKAVNNHIIKIALTLSENPRLQGSKKLKGGSEHWRIRVGDYRVIYAIDDEILIIDIRKVGHRKDIYNL